MGISSMKTFILCVLIVGMVALNEGVEAKRASINPGVLDPCLKPGGPHPGCSGPRGSNGARKPVNPYNRGCLKFNRCRG
ncbi:RALF-like 30 [Prunus dulcis]|uniref:RALF-like 30 n=1 Tax=Prunus dulcis TaxID=3755 RepID=A0A5H2Y124_PRUDU|nr:hypothetical protein L3X38_044605 [Prunus dulcis]BBN67190.1 RALF-like 30 [Prunus dulcis]